ncbi:TonB-dependent receptor [uncultured Sphingomonas sp.]|uniref:TonB-dependent receptor n=1 Tax=uncultured Sphingomonas sp. TaxID=158754 RepID=UPI00259A6080|nr:TonB-dependent receptor [uncultured Sphingomonas sp.]
MKAKALRTLMIGVSMVGIMSCAAQAHAAPEQVAQNEAGASRPSGEGDSANDEKMSDIIVTGFRQSYLDALRMKRDDLGISDSISSDGLGRFPDLNVGEALQRIPGVQLNRETGSRDATINLRGLPGSYARYTVNGQSFADPILDGSTPLGAFNADVFSAISVRKTIASGDQAGGISGIVDLQIAPALGRKDGGFFKIAGEYNTLGKYDSPAVTAGYNKHLSDTFAVFGVVAYKKERFRRDSIFINAYSPLPAATTPNFSQYLDYYSPFNANGSCPSGKVCAAGATGAKSTTGVLFPSDVRQVVKFNEGDLVTGAAGAEWKPTDTLRLGLMGFYTRRNLKNNLTNLLEIDMRSNLAVKSPTAAPVIQADGNAYVQGVNYTNAQINDSIRSEPLLEQMWDGIASAEWKSEGWRISGTLTKSRGENNGLQTQIDIRNLPRAAAGGNGVNGAINSGGASIGDYQLTLNRNPALIVPAGPYSWSASNQPTQIAANGDQLIVAGSSGYGLNQVTAGQGEVERDVGVALIRSILLGGRYEHASYTSRGYRTSAKGVQTQNLDASVLGGNPYASSFFGGSVAGYLSNWPQLNYDQLVSKLQPVIVATGDLLTPTGWINDPTNSSYSLFNFTVRNNIAAGYGQANLAFNIGGVPFTGYAGLRYEHTDQLINALSKQVGANGAIVYVPLQFHQQYGNWLPSFYLSADLTDRLVLRGAYYKAFVRPQPRNLTPATAVSVNSTGYSIQYGGYDLKPYSADSEDVSLEWYNRPGGLFAVAGYRKIIRNLISAETRLSRLCPADATQFGLGQLTTIGTTCYSNQLVNGQPAIVTASGNFNQPNPITVTGVEVTVQQNLDFLPGLLRNLGGQVNYSFARITGTNADGTKATLPGVSKNNVNLVGYYESPFIGFRVVYTWRDQYTLTGGNSFTGGQSFVAPRSQVDSSLALKFSDRYSLSLDAFNLFDAKRIQYQVTPNIPRQADYDGRTFTLSFRGSF